MVQPTEKIQSAASKRNFQVRFLALRPWQTAALPAALYAMIVGAGFGEETVFRGYIFERFRKLFGSGVWAKTLMVLLTAIWFGLGHYSVQGLAGAAQATIVGTIFAATSRIWM